MHSKSHSGDRYDRDGAQNQNHGRVWAAFTATTSFEVALAVGVDGFAPERDVLIYARDPAVSDPVMKPLGEVFVAFQSGRIDSRVWEPLMDSVRKVLLARMGVNGLHRLAKYFLQVSQSKQLLMD
jgi:hypothetical protein